MPVQAGRHDFSGMDVVQKHIAIELEQNPATKVLASITVSM
jgi:hypothetical protein